MVLKNLQNTTLNFNGRSKKKKNVLEIFARGPLISNLNKINQLVLVAKLGDG